MRILLVHNRYQQKGGEDYVFDAEGELLSQHGNLVQRLEFNNRDIKTPVDQFLTALGLVYNRSSEKRLEEKILSFHPDIIHVHNFVALASPSIFFAANKYHIPVVLTLHNYRLICPSATLFFKHHIYEKSVRTIFPINAILHGVYRNSILQTAAIATMTFIHHLLGTWKKRIARYIVLTNFEKKKFDESALSIPQNKFALKPNFVSDYGEGEPVREDFFLFVGRLTEEKGIDTLLKAAILQNFNLVIIGEGPLKNEVAKAAREHSNIKYLGLQNKTTVVSYLKKCRAMIFPSVWYEGFPITILEAFSTGTPVIASNLGSMAEIVRDCFNGLHFEAGNEHNLCNAVKNLMCNPVLGANLSHNARLTYEREFTPEINYEILFNIYSTAIAETNPSSGKYEEVAA